MKRFSKIERVPRTGSTNDDMAAILGEGRARGLVLVAGVQTAGAGRRGRAWIAPEGSALLCTLALPDAVESRNLWMLPFWSALVVHDALAQFGIDSLLQWPNDVLVEGRKVSGILCVSRVVGDRAWAGCGIGINVVRPRDAAEIANITPAPAFVSDTRPATVDAVLAALLDAAEQLYTIREDASQITALWHAAAQLPRAYRIQKDNEAQPFDTTALRLDATGSLIVERDGREEAVSLADARVLR